MSAKKKAKAAAAKPRAKQDVAKAKKPAPPVLVFRLGDFTAARHAVAVFDLPPKFGELAFYLYDKKHDPRAKTLAKIPEPDVPEELVERAFTLADALLELTIHSDDNPMGEGPWMKGYHASARFEDVVAAFAVDGFQVLTLADVRGKAQHPRREAATKKRLARGARELAKQVDPAMVERVARWIEEGGPEPEAPSTVVATFASVLLDQALELWGPMEDRAFHLAARAKALPGLAASDVDEGVGVDRWGLLSERLRRAGWSDEEIDFARLDGLAGDIFWRSATWYAMSFLPRLEALAQSVLMRGATRSPTPALTRLLVDPLDDLPDELQELYRPAVKSALASPGILRALPDESWADRGISLPAAPKKPAPPQAPAALKLSATPRLGAVKRLYGVDLPEEILAVWDLASSLSPDDPTSAFAGDDLVALSLVGPFEVLAGRTVVKPGLDMRLHWRFRFDPPELLTLMMGNEDGLHFGYWLDDPAAGPSCVAFYYAHDSCELSVAGITLWETIRGWLERAHAGAVEGMREEPGYEARYVKDLVAIGRLRERLVEYATRERTEIGAAYEKKYELRGLRALQTVAMTPEGMGIVAPPERYRPLSRTGADLAKALGGKAPPKRLVEEALALAAKGFPASALELGRHCWRRARDEAAYALLDAAYAGLGRPALREILAVHRAHRDLADVSVLED